MTTKPTAARGKTTTKGKFKKMTKQISDVLKMSKKNQGLLGLPKSTRPKMVSLEDTDKINAARDKITERLEKFIPTTGIAGVGASTATKNIMKKIRKLKPTGRISKLELDRASNMSAGGEVDIDMTTEIDV